MLCLKGISLISCYIHVHVLKHKLVQNDVENKQQVIGVLIDDKLTFKDHEYMCVKKASQVYNMS